MPSENSTDESRGGSAARTVAGPDRGTPDGLTGGLTPPTVTGPADRAAGQRVRPDRPVPPWVKPIASVSVVVPTLVG